MEHINGGVFRGIIVAGISICYHGNILSSTRSKYIWVLLHIYFDCDANVTDYKTLLNFSCQT